LAIQQEDVSSEATNSDENTKAEELNPGGQETMLENNQTHNVGIPRITMAPGEDPRPLDVILDADSEELAFPSIYAGVKRPSSKSYTTIVRSELR